MNIEMRKTEALRPYEKNPRVIPAEAVEKVAESIKKFGFKVPLVVDGEGVVICGHTRLKAAKHLDLIEVPVIVASDLTPEQIRAFRVADNRLAQLTDWDYEILPLELKDLQGMNFDLEMLGFGSEELEKILGAGIHGNTGLTDPDDAPEPPDAAVTQPGDLWLLGGHRLLCGDSAKAGEVDRLLSGAKVQLVNTDPPYNVRVEPRSNNAIAAGLSSFGDPNTHHQALDLARFPEKANPTHRKLRPKDRPLENDFVTDEEFDRLLRAWFGNIARVLEPGRSFYLWGGYANCANYPPVLKELGLYFSQALIWVKEHPVMTRKDFMGNHEWCQPGSTMVLTPEGEVPIASLQDGDRVVGFRLGNQKPTGRQKIVPVRVAKRPYIGPLLRVHAGGRETWCTPNHIWSVRLAAQAGEGDGPQSLVRARDLRPGLMLVPVLTRGRTEKALWTPIQSVEQASFDGKVYSLDVPDLKHYAADGIVTHNCFYGWREGAAHYFNPEIHNATDVWQVKKINPQTMEHLTQKPAELAVRAMTYSSRPGEHVLDLFGGSGSTLIGAEQTGRKAFLMEIDPLYCDVIVDRFQRFTGVSGILERTGTSPIPMKAREEKMR
jgi:DNA modification methylase